MATDANPTRQQHKRHDLVMRYLHLSTSQHTAEEPFVHLSIFVCLKLPCRNTSKSRIGPRETQIPHMRKTTTSASHRLLSGIHGHRPVRRMDWAPFSRRDLALRETLCPYHKAPMEPGLENLSRWSSRTLASTRSKSCVPHGSATLQCSSSSR
jgi:hypothetical protein